MHERFTKFSLSISVQVFNVRAGTAQLHGISSSLLKIMLMSQTTGIAPNHSKSECPCNLTVEQRHFVDIVWIEEPFVFPIEAQSVLRISCSVVFVVSTVT